MVLAFLRILPDFMVWGSDCKGLTGSGVTVCTGLAGLINCCFSAIILLSHIKDTSSILCRTYEIDFESRRVSHDQKHLGNTHLRDERFSFRHYGILKDTSGMMEFFRGIDQLLQLLERLIRWRIAVLRR